jgi:crotonobetainyl-CoA:carnitine CoA-transferase CaiB-like acyl-CoA transferase
VAALNGVAPGTGTGGRPATRGPEGVYHCLDDRPADVASGEVDGDRWLAVSCRDERDRRALATVVGGDVALAAEPDGLERRLAAWAAERDPWAASAALRAVDVPASPVETLRDLLFVDKGAAAVFHPVDLGDGLSALVREEPILWDGQRLPIRMRAPIWFEHTEEVLCGELGVSDEEFGQLIADGVLF